MRNSLLAFLVALSALPAHAIVVFGSTGRLLMPPTDTALRACWDLEGQWGHHLGTPIAPHWFISAAHVGGEVGDTFWFDGKPYTAVALEGILGTDLALWRVDRPFPRWATLSQGDELGRALFLVGRGTARGERLPEGGGWAWGADDYQQSWGTNRATSTLTRDGWGELLLWTFDDGQGATEGTISRGDSGGGVFVQGDDGHWYLAGVNHDMNPGPQEADRLYTRSSQPQVPFFASVYDGRGLLLDGVLLQGNTPIPMTSGAARIAPYRDRIDAILQRPDSAYPRSASILQTRRGKRGLAALLGVGLILFLLKRNRMGPSPPCDTKRA